VGSRCGSFNGCQIKRDIFFLNEPLLLHRRYEGTNSPKNVKTCKGRALSAENDVRCVNVLKDNVKALELNEGAIDRLNHLKVYLSAKLDFFSTDLSINKLLRQFKYINYYPSIYSWGGDIFIRLREGNHNCINHQL
jgi:hypothetical protein